MPSATQRWTPSYASPSGLFGLSISRVDPLPHQLEAVYDHLLKLPRVRFLLADDAGAAAACADTLTDIVELETQLFESIAV